MYKYQYYLTLSFTLLVCLLGLWSPANATTVGPKTTYTVNASFPKTPIDTFDWQLEKSAADIQIYLIVA